MTLVSGLSRRASRLVEIQTAIVVLSVFIIATASAITSSAIETRRLHAGFGPLTQAQHASETPAMASVDDASLID